MSGKVDTGGVAVPFTGIGEIDNASRRSRLVMTLVGAGRIEMMVDAKSAMFYMRFPLLSRSLRVTKPWLSIDLSTASKTLGAQAGLSDLLQRSDLAQQLGIVGAATGPVSRVGTERVRGSATTHYRTTIRYAKLAEFLSSDAARAARADGAKTAPLDVWVGEDGYLHRIRYALTVARGDRPLASTVTYDLYDFGTVLDVALPPASQTQDLTKLIRGPGGSG
jgi:hypothetical protein